MKNLLAAFLLIFVCHTAQAQFFSLGIKGGLSTQVNKPGDIVVDNGDNDYSLSVDKRQFGTQFGAYMRIGGGIFVQPEVVFNSTKTDYRFGESTVGEVIKNERYQFLDIPVLLGLKLGPIRVMAGPVGHYFLNSRSELTDIDGYEARFKQMTWGYQTGLNLSLGRISFDARYEGNFSKDGNHITFFGDKYNFSKAPARFILGMNIALIK